MDRQQRELERQHQLNRAALTQRIANGIPWSDPIVDDLEGLPNEVYIETDAGIQLSEFGERVSATLSLHELHGPCEVTVGKGAVIEIGEDITIQVVEIRGDTVRLGVVKPKDIPVHREEVLSAATMRR